MSNVITFEVEQANPSRKVTEHMLKRRALEWAKKRLGRDDITIVNGNAIMVVSSLAAAFSMAFLE